MIHGYVHACVCVYERWLVITKGFFISLSLGTRQQRHKLPPEDYPLISTNALSLILINVPAFMIPSLVCDLIKQSVLHLAASSPISSWFPCILLKYLHYNLSSSLFSTDRSAVATLIITVDTMNNNYFNSSSLDSRQQPGESRGSASGFYHTPNNCYWELEAGVEFWWCCLKFSEVLYKQPPNNLVTTQFANMLTMTSLAEC